MKVLKSCNGKRWRHYMHWIHNTSGNGKQKRKKNQRPYLREAMRTTSSEGTSSCWKRGDGDVRPSLSLSNIQNKEIKKW